MPALPNPKHERFAQGLAKGKSQAEAYSEAGYAGDFTAASRLSRNVKVKARLSELQERGAVRVELTLADIIDELDEARRAALAATTPQTGSAVAATMGKAKLLGLIVDKAEVKSEVEVTDARERLAHIVAGHTAAGSTAGRPN